MGTLRRVIISDVTCDGPDNAMPAIICGIPGHPIEDISIRDVYLMQRGGGSAQLAAVTPPEEARLYPEPNLFGPLPAQGLFARHARNLEVCHFEIASETPDARPFVWLGDVDGANFSGLKLPCEAAAPAFELNDTRNFRVSDSVPVADAEFDTIAHGSLR